MIELRGNLKGFTCRVREFKDIWNGEAWRSYRSQGLSSHPRSVMEEWGACHIEI
jgi:hypothetical protein